MSLTLLQSFVSEITANDAEMAKNKKDIDDIKSQLIIMNDYIKALKDFDVKEEKEEEEIRADIKDIQQKIAALKAKIALQVAVDVDAAVVIVDLQAEIMALKAKIELHETINSEDNEIINQEVDNLQEDMLLLQAGRWCRFDRNIDIRGNALSCVLYSNKRRNRIGIPSRE